MPIPFIAAAVLGGFAGSVINELGRQATRRFLGTHKSSRTPITPTVVVESPKHDASLEKRKNRHYEELARLKRDELRYRRKHDEYQAEIALANSKFHEEVKSKELALREQELTLKQRENTIRKQIAELEHEDRQEVLSIKRQELNNIQEWQQTQFDMAVLERNFRAEQSQEYWNVLRELKEQDVETKITEIQLRWDSIEKNWPSTLSRLDTEKILGELKRGVDSIPLLVLVAKPNFPENISSSLFYNFYTQFRFQLKKRLQNFPVDYLDSFFNRGVEDTDIKLLESVIKLRPTIILYSDVTEEDIYFHTVAWGWPESDSCSFCERVSLKRDDSTPKEEFDFQNDFGSVTEEIILAYEFVAVSLIDWYYANYDLTYEPKLPEILAEHSETTRSLFSEYSEALETVSKLNNAKLKYVEGINLSKLGYYDHAISSFNEAREIWPDFPGSEAQILIQNQLKADWENVQTLSIDASNTLALACSLDGQFIIIAKDHTVELWQSDGDILSPRSIDYSTDCFIDSIALSSDNRRIAIARDDYSVDICDLRTGKLCSSLQGHTGPITSLAFNQDGRRLASSSKDGTARIWDAASGEEYSCLDSHTEAVRSVIFSSVDHLLATSSDDQTIKIWHSDTGEEIRELIGHSNWVRCVMVSDDGDVIASASDDKTIKLWAVESGDLIQTIEGHEEWISSFCFSTNGNVLISGGHDCAVKVWDTRTGKSVKTMSKHKGAVIFVGIQDNGHLLISADVKNIVQVWKLSKA